MAYKPAGANTSVKGDGQPVVLLVFRRHVESFGHLPFALASGGLRVEAAYTPYTRHIRYSRWLRAAHALPYEPGEFAGQLNGIVSKNEYAMVILVDEPSLIAVYDAPVSEKLSRCLPLPVRSEIANTVGRKDLFQEFIERHQIPCPRTIRAGSREEARKAAGETGIPLVLKGREGSSGNSVQIVREASQLEPALRHYKEDEVILVQEFIEGVTAAATFFSWNGQLRAWIATSKHIALSNGKGPTVVADFIDNPKVGRICERLSKLGAIHGITGFDFMQDAQGEVYVIDPHFGRMTTLAHLGPLCGVEFGRALREAIDGEETEWTPRASNIRAVKFPEFLILVYEGGLLNLLREAAPWRKDIKYSVVQPGEWRLSGVLFLLTLKSLFFCFLGAIKARLLGKRI
jgi:hypothetical protein